MKSKNQLINLLYAVIFVLFGCSENHNSSKDGGTEIASSDFQISLAQWSLHRKYFGDIQARGGYDWFLKTLRENPDDAIAPGEDPMNFPMEAAKYGVSSIELVNTFYFGKAEDQDYWTRFKQKCDEAGVSVGLIMCDLLGNLGDADENVRNTAVENHYNWVDVAKFLGAHTIRVNAAGQGSAQEVAKNAIDGLRKLGEYGKQQGINIVVENHGGYSSDGSWLAGVMKTVGMDNVGTLPDFGNFCVENGPEGCTNMYDRYQGIAELMPYAKAVSAKSHDFNENGDEVNSDYYRIMKIVKDSGYKGYIGIEYEGGKLLEEEGIRKTKTLLERAFESLN